MQRFADLYEALDGTTSTLAKVAAMSGYFRVAPAADAAWALYFLTGRRPKRLLPTKQLVEWAIGCTGMPDWMFSESYAVVGDLAETVALLLDTASPRREAANTSSQRTLSQWMEQVVLPLRKLDPLAQRELVVGCWQALPRREVFLLNKLLTGELRVGVSSTLVVRAVAESAQLTPTAISHRLMGTWEPSPEFYAQLVQADHVNDDVSRPLPFYLASPLEAPVESLGERSGWQAEWKWDGIRGQLIRRAGQVFLWSRGEELVTERFPEITEAALERLPDGTVLDGEVLTFAEGQPLPFAQLQRRIGRQKLTAKVLAEAPVVFMGYDVLELGGEDLRERPLAERRSRLEQLLTPVGEPFHLSGVLSEPTWEALATTRQEARARNVEGLMLKRLDSPYKSGRKRGDWWKWKIDPFTVDAVLLYAHPGNGKRANLFTDYTFAVWNGDALVPVAKAYSGLTDEEIATLDAWIRAHTTERFGPSRAVEPVQVFELHFEGISQSARHKSGVALRFPRMARWRTDKPASEADTLESLKKLL